MRIEILGPGCARCRRLHQMVNRSIKKGNIRADVVKVEDINEISEKGVMLTPALIVDGELMFEGKLPQGDRIDALLKKLSR